jgi:hypothetical protein
MTIDEFIPWAVGAGYESIEGRLLAEARRPTTVACEGR